MSQNLLEKYQGSLLGLAIGDALGVPAEFKMVGDFEPVNDFRDSDWFDLPAGHWSDDTAMALCLANSLIEKKSFDPVDQIEKYKKWLETGYCSSTGKAIGIGQTILRALLTYRSGDDPYVAISSRHSDGNGSLMRLAPIPLYFRNNPKQAIQNAESSSKITHGSKLCGDACKYYTGLIIGALNGVSKKELLSDLYSPISNFWKDNQLTEEIENIALGSFKQNDPPFIQGSGYVVKSMEAALWAFYNSESFEDGVLKAVNLGDDADTTGAIYGQLAGAYYGINGIPKKWVTAVVKKDEILEIANKLFELS
jgi:ADP-ribosylglycohydrolase